MTSSGWNRIKTARAIALLLMGFAGCGYSGAPIGQVAGTVTLDGQPLANAFVKFHPQSEGRSSQAKTDEDGHYVLQYVAGVEGARVGKHAVQITTYVEPDVDDRGTALDAGKPELVPAKYNDQSELVAEVKRGSQTIDFDLKTE